MIAVCARWLELGMSADIDTIQKRLTRPQIGSYVIQEQANQSRSKRKTGRPESVIVPDGVPKWPQSRS